jgi:hypothetical protein
MAFKVKFNGQGDVEKYNARLMARGFIQVVSIDYMDFFNIMWKYIPFELY